MSKLSRRVSGDATDALGPDDSISLTFDPCDHPSVGMAGGQLVLVIQRPRRKLARLSVMSGDDEDCYDLVIHNGEPRLERAPS